VTVDEKYNIAAEDDGFRWGGKGFNTVKVGISEYGLLKSQKIKKFVVSAKLMNAEDNSILNNVDQSTVRAANREFSAQFDTSKVKNFRFGNSPMK
jgi:hypothetical protein